MVSLDSPNSNSLMSEELMNYFNQQFTKINQELDERSSACHQALDTIENDLHLASDIFKEFARTNEEYQSDIYELYRDINAVGAVASLVISATAAIPVFCMGGFMIGGGIVASMTPNAAILIKRGIENKTIQDMRKMDNSLNLTKLQAIKLYEVAKIVISKLEHPQKRDDREKSMRMILGMYHQVRSNKPYTNFNELHSGLAAWAHLLPKFHFKEEIHHEQSTN